MGPRRREGSSSFDPRRPGSGDRPGPAGCAEPPLAVDGDRAGRSDSPPRRFVTSTAEADVYEALKRPSSSRDSRFPSTSFARPSRGDSLANVNAMVGEVLSQRNLVGTGREAQPLSGGCANEVHHAGDRWPRIRNRVSIGQADSIRKDRRGGSTQQLFEVRSFSAEDPDQRLPRCDERVGEFVRGGEPGDPSRAGPPDHGVPAPRADSIGAGAPSCARRTARSPNSSGPIEASFRVICEPTLNKLDRLEQQRAAAVHGRSPPVSRRSLDLSSLGPGGGFVTTDGDPLPACGQQTGGAELGVNTEEHPNVIASSRADRSGRRQARTTSRERGRQQRSATRQVTSDPPGSSRSGGERAQRAAQRRRSRASGFAGGPHSGAPGRVQTHSRSVRTCCGRATSSSCGRFRPRSSRRQLESAQQGPRVTVLDRAQPPRRAPPSRVGSSLVVGLIGTRSPRPSPSASCWR